MQTCRKKAVSNFQFIFQKDVLCFTRVQHVQTYHLIYVCNTIVLSDINRQTLGLLLSGIVLYIKLYKITAFE